MIQYRIVIALAPSLENLKKKHIFIWRAPGKQFHCISESFLKQNNTKKNKKNKTLPWYVRTLWVTHADYEM